MQASWVYRGEARWNTVGSPASGHKGELEQVSSKQAEYAGGKLSVQEELRPPGQAASGAAEATTANSCNLGQQQHQCQCHKNWCSETKKRFKVLQSHNFQKEAGPQLFPLVRLFQCDKAQPDGWESSSSHDVARTHTNKRAAKICICIIQVFYCWWIMAIKQPPYLLKHSPCFLCWEAQVPDTQ